ncbi:MAG: flagellar hook-associated protein FlgK [Planctomycetes bacterium]|nr:flagellar hook-associated protein FlgK [Planctomycetota bacterium]
MSDFSIGISGIQAAHNAMTTIGNNIANIATEGYHRQRVNLRANDPEYAYGISIGQGVITLEPTRMIDRFIELAILKQEAAGEQYSRELSVLKSIENILGDMNGTGLSTTITDFYNSLKQLSSDPQNDIEQGTVSNQATVLASQFNTIGRFLEETAEQIHLEAVNLAGEINTLSASVAEMNIKLQALDIQGVEGSNLRDHRDQAITEISRLIGVTTQQEGTGAIVNVFIGGIPIVMGTNSTSIEISPVTSGTLGISPVDVKIYNTEARGGKLGGLIGVKNEYLGTLKQEFDALALDIITTINKYHVQGVPSYNKDTETGGSFTSLDGWVMASDNLSEIVPAISDGTINVRVTNTTTGVITRYSINIVAATDTMTSIAAQFDSINGLSSSINNSSLHIEADSNYKFDFIPSPLPASEPTILSYNLLGTSVPSFGGTYTGTSNQNFTMTTTNVTGFETVGTDAFDVEVRDQSGTLVDTINVPIGYTPGDALTTVDGMEISFAAGTVANAEIITVKSPIVSGVYLGDADETYTCTVNGTGVVGVTGGLSLTIRNSANQLVNTVNIGSGYSAASTFVVDSSQGIKLQMDAGSLVNGQTFQIEALADSDTSDFLAVSGINSFFKGYDATSIALSERIGDSAAQISVSMGIEMTDNENIKRISQLSEKPMASLGTLTHEGYYRKITTGLAQDIRVKTINQENSENVKIELKNQRDEVSGVDINNEAAELMIYEQMFQSMAKYMNMIKDSMQEIMNIL